MEYEEFVRRFNERANQRRERFEKAAAKAQSEVRKIATEANKAPNRHASPKNIGIPEPTMQAAPRRTGGGLLAPTAQSPKRKSPAHRQRRVQGILKNM